MNSWIIKDWTGKICFQGKTFETFEDAWGYIYEMDPIPEGEKEANYYDDYFVETI